MMMVVIKASTSREKRLSTNNRTQRMTAEIPRSELFIHPCMIDREKVFPFYFLKSLLTKLTSKIIQFSFTNN